MSGIRIKSENFAKITEALEKAGIDWSVWNAEVMFIENYDGPIDLECHERFDEFERIIRSIEPQQKGLP